MLRIMMMAAAVAPAFAATGSTAEPAAKPAVPSRLLPLSEQDMFSGPETGCQLSFSQGNDSFIFIIGSRFTYRTDAGITNCTISQEDFSGFGSDNRAMFCGGRTFAIRATGNTRTYPQADSAETPAALTMTEAGESRTVRGIWGSAC